MFPDLVHFQVEIVGRGTDSESGVSAVDEEQKAVLVLRSACLPVLGSDMLGHCISARM